MKKILSLKKLMAALTVGSLVLNFASAAPIIWNGMSGAGLNWSTAGNWIGGVVPTSADDVKFFDDGADPTPGNPNNIVNSLFSGSVLSLQYAQSNLLYHTTQIDPGQTLAVLGSFTVGTEAISAQNITAAISGSGTLVVSNTAADIVIREGGNGTSRRATLDMSGLDTFIAEVDQLVIGRGDPPGLPNVNRNTGYLYLAKTNRIHAASPSASSSTVGIEVGRSASNNGNGSRLYLGQTNVIFASSLGIGFEKETGCQMLFNLIFPDPVAFIRGADGSGRMDLWAIGDGEANSGTTSCQGTSDFTGGTVNALVDVMTVGRASSNTGGTGNSRGTLTFGAGTIDVNTLQVGLQTASTGKNGDGTVNVNGGTLNVNNSLELGVATGGAGVATTIGRLNITGGTVRANEITTGATSGGSFITVTSGTLAVTNTAGTTAASLGDVSLSDTTLYLGTVAATPRMVVTNLTTGGAGNIISVGLIPAITSYPVTFPLIKYQGAIIGSGYNFTMTGLSAAYTGSLVDNSVNGSVDLVITAGPVAQAITWNGGVDGNWNSSTKNWRVGVTDTNYFDGDFATFNDAATGTTTINLTTSLFPGSVTVNNSALNYTFNGSGRIAGLSGLTKSGSGSLLLNNAGQNGFAGGVTINGGTVQIGNGGTSGNLGSGAVSNNASLVFNRSDDLDVINDISGSATGSITKNGTGVLTLSGANNFSGAVTVAQGTLKAGSTSALGTADGSTTINNGATLDVNDVNLGSEPVIVSGSGVGGLGAIVENTGSAGFNQANLAFVTLVGDTTFGGTGRWDLRSSNTGDPTLAALSTGGQPYKLTKVGPNGIYFPGVTVDPALGDIDIVEGTLAIESATTGLGDPTKNLVVHAGATLQVYNLTNLLNKVITLNGSGTNLTVNNASGNCTIVGPMTLIGDCLFNAGGTSLTLSNTIAGTGNLIKVGGAILTLAGGNDSYTGSTTVSNGTLLVNGIISGGSTLTTLTNTTLGGIGTNVGPVIVGGTLSPGTSAGTLTTGPLTLSPGASLTFELAPINTVGTGINDLVQVNGDLTVNGNAIVINMLAGSLQPGTYRLFNYTGNLVGSFDPTVSLGGGVSRYGFTLDTTTVGQVNLVVSGSAGRLKWSGLSSTTWDITNSPNWLNIATTLSDVFYQGDSVLLDDTATGFTLDIPAGVSVVPSTITNDTANLYTINGPGSISGAASIVKRGSGTLSIASANDFSGVVKIEQGTVQVANNAALGSVVGETIVVNGGSLDVGNPTAAANAINLGLEPITVSGTGFADQGAIINSTSVNQQNAVRLVTLAGDTSLGGNGRWDIRGAGATLSTGGNAYKLTKTGASQVSMVAVAVDPALGDIDMQSGTLSVETGTTSLGDPAKNLTVQIGATLQFYQLANPLNKIITLNGSGGGNTLFADNGNASQNLITGPMTLIGDCWIGARSGNFLTLSNTITGSGGITKVDTATPGTGTLRLMGTVSYTGNTEVRGGTLALVGPASIANSPLITLGAGTVLDVSGRADGLQTILSNHTLLGLGKINGSLQVNAGGTVSPGNDLLAVPIGNLTVTNTVTLAGTNVMQTDKSSLTNDVIDGAVSITFGGVLNVSDVFAVPYADGDSFQLFNAASYSGSFSSIVPATPGTGLFWDTSALATSGILKVVATSPPPIITTVSQSGGNLSFSGSGGAPGSQYYVLTSPSLSVPLTNWTSIVTNNFDGSGNFLFSTPILPGVPQSFYLLKLP